MIAKTPKETKRELKKEMERIRDLWDHYFLEYKLLSNMLRYANNTNHKYVGVIIGNLIDTFDIIYTEHTSNSYAGNMSLMQAIYIQQDIIEELLHIFKCGISKNDLKNDANYNTNRDIRNELMGHPIRKIRGELISTTLLAYNGPDGCINYMRYHKDNDFSFEMMSHNIEEIVSRHTEFIKTYFEKIIAQIEIMMQPFMKKIRHLDSISRQIEFPCLLDFVFRRFETIKDQDFVYDKESLKIIYEKRNDHIRYQNLIDRFYCDLKESINGKLDNLDKIFNPKEDIDKDYQIPEVIINIMEDLANENDEELEIASIETNKRKSFHYELGKLSTKHELFDMFHRILIKEFSENELIVEELDHMKKYQYSDIEYYCAYRLLRQEVEKYEDTYS